MEPSSLIALWKLITLHILVMIKFYWYDPTALLCNKFLLLLTLLIDKKYIMFWKSGFITPDAAAFVSESPRALTRIH